jgi:hypothetical protein
LFSECRLLQEELNGLNNIAVKETDVIMIAKVDWIRQTIVTQFARFQCLDGYCIGDFVQPFEYSVGRSEVADSCHRRVPEKLVVTNTAQVVLGAPVR